PVDVCDSEVAKRLRGDDVHFDLCAQPLDRVCHETAGRVAVPARIRSGENCDAHHDPTAKAAYPNAPVGRGRSFGCLHAAQYEGSPETWRKSCMYERLPSSVVNTNTRYLL